MTRKAIKEGMEMERIYGEQSYLPRPFYLTGFFEYSDYDWNKHFAHRKLPGNIMIAAYEQPRTETELAMELGISAPYIEDELQLLEKDGLITERGGKYCTAIPIFDNEYLRELKESISGFLEEETKHVMEELYKSAPVKDKAISSYHALFIALRKARNAFEGIAWKRMGGVPLLNHGARGVLLGISTEYPEKVSFNGVNYNLERIAYFSTFACGEDEFCIISSLSMDEADILHQAILGECIQADQKAAITLIEKGIIKAEKGKLLPCFPVFTETELKGFENQLGSLGDLLESYLHRAAKIAFDLAAKTAPQRIRALASSYAYAGMIGPYLSSLYMPLSGRLECSGTKGIIGVTV